MTKMLETRLGLGTCLELVGTADCKSLFSHDMQVPEFGTQSPKTPRVPKSHHPVGVGLGLGSPRESKKLLGNRTDPRKWKEKAALWEERPAGSERKESQKRSKADDFQRKVRAVLRAFEPANQKEESRGPGKRTSWAGVGVQNWL